MKIATLCVLSAFALAVALAGLSGPAVAMGSSSDAIGAKTNPDYAAADKLIKAKDYKGAIPLLEKVVAAEPKNADAFNLLGYSHRHLKDNDKALAHYRKALEISPDHRGANEYLGQLYLILGDLPKAEERLARLDRICAFGCEEFTELKKAVAAFKAKKGS
ncbi:MAG: tetratricopeptide repeat protein [Alphaproteobacteria bacterium]|nr:tetratricopeptide repeat protein [Alphaproteobacteria bacterium]